MRIPAHVIASLLLALTLALNAAFWGGVGLSPALGSVVRQPLPMQAPLAYTWLLIGENLGRPLGLQDSLVAFAEGNIEDLPRVVEGGPLAVERLLQSQAGWIGILHGAPLILLPITVFLWWRRPRGLKTFGGR